MQLASIRPRGAIFPYGARHLMFLTELRSAPSPTQCTKTTPFTGGRPEPTVLGGLDRVRTEQRPGPATATYRTVAMIGTIARLQRRTSRAHWTICAHVRQRHISPRLSFRTGDDVLPRSGDVIHVTKAASVQFAAPMLFRVIRVHDWPTYEGWIWLDGYELNAVRRRGRATVHLRAGQRPATGRQGAGPAGPQRPPAGTDHGRHPGPHPAHQPLTRLSLVLLAGRPRRRRRRGRWPTWSAAAAMISVMTVSAGTCCPSAGSLSITVPAGESLVTKRRR